MSPFNVSVADPILEHQLTESEFDRWWARWAEVMTSNGSWADLSEAEIECRHSTARAAWNASRYIHLIDKDS